MKKVVTLLWDEDNKYEKIIIFRPAVEAEEQKLDPYVYPSFYLLNKMKAKIYNN